MWTNWQRCVLAPRCDPHRREYLVQLGELAPPAEAPAGDHHVETEGTSGHREEVLRTDLAWACVREALARESGRIEWHRNPGRRKQPRPGDEFRPGSIFRERKERTSRVDRGGAAIAELAVVQGQREVRPVQRGDPTGAPKQASAPPLRQLDVDSVGAQDQLTLSTIAS